MNGLAYSGSNGNYYFYTGANPDTLQPLVTEVAPGNGATNIGVNAIVRVTFNKVIDTVTVNPTTLSLASGGNPIPYTFTFDSTNTINITPQAPLPGSANVTVSLTNGVTDDAGNALTPLSATFTTSAGPNFTLPTIISSTLAAGDTNVPANSVFTFAFDRPMDTRTFVSGNNVYIYDEYLGTYVPVTLSFGAGSTQVTVTPASPLAADRSYYVEICSVEDLTGNTSGCYQYSFTTTLLAASGGPQVLKATPLDNATGVAVNFQPDIQFDRPIARTSIGGVTLTTSGVPVPYTPTFSTGDTIVTLAPNSILQPNTAYVLTISGVTDQAGNAMSGSVVRHFTTSTGIDLVAPRVVSVTPVANSITGTNPVLRMTFNEPVDPIRSSGAYLYNSNTGTDVPGTVVGFSADWMSMTLTYPGQLNPGTPYTFYGGTIYDLAGNTVGAGSDSFTTGAGSDTSPLTVVGSTPLAGSVGIPINPLISLQMSQPVNPTSLTASSVTLLPAAPGTLQLSTDGYTLTYALTGTLANNTTYAISASGFSDVNGNLVTPFSSSFTTSAVKDTAAGTITLTTPAPNSTNVSVSTPITVALSAPVDPLSVVPNAFEVYAGSNRVAGTIAIGSNGGSLTFTPDSQLPPTTTISIYVGYNASLKDLAGNTFSYLYNAQFKTNSTVDTTAPYVISATPANNAMSVGPKAVVTLAFSESINPSTINAQNFALFNGYQNLNAGVSVSSDNSTVMLSATLPYGATITVNVNQNVQDLQGNALAAAFISTFTTIPKPLTATPSVTQIRPGSGATGVPLNSVITLYTTAPVNPATVGGALSVSQNGALIGGTTAVSSDGQSIVFTPTNSLAQERLNRSS